MKTYEKIPRFVPDTCKGCKGHGVYMLDETYEDKESRELLCKVLDNYIEKDTTKIS